MKHKKYYLALLALGATLAVAGYASETKAVSDFSNSDRVRAACAHYERLADGLDGVEAFWARERFDTCLRHQSKVAFEASKQNSLVAALQRHLISPGVLSCSCGCC